MIFKGLGFLGFPGFVLESQRAWGLPIAGVLCVSLLVRDSQLAGVFCVALLVRDSPLAGVFLFFGLQ